MGELGDDAPALHAEMGRVARELGIVRLFTCGELAADAAKAFGDGAEHFDDALALAVRVNSELHNGVCLLVKGSRAARMERVVEALRLPGEPGEAS
jgi:UDP-N-acetylmuramoyl-tripeptide--D-alanyl-D-alanine ligase